MNRWISSDYHFLHGNILKYCGRPFDNAWEMTEKIIENHNAVVAPNDEFYHLGDFMMGSPGRAIELLKRLNGKKYFIRGNHDKAFRKQEVQLYTEWVKDYHELTIQDHTIKGGKQLIVMCHYAMRVWNKSHWGSIMLYGHSHGTLPEDPNVLSIDVGIDAIAKRYAVDGILNPDDYRPICYEEIKGIMELKSSTNIIRR